MALSFNTFVVSRHALIQCVSRSILLLDAENVARSGEIIRDYPQDQPHPCFLCMSWVNGRALHVVVALDAAAFVGILVTAYWPDPATWDADFKKRSQP